MGAIYPSRGENQVEVARRNGLYADNRRGWRGAVASMFGYSVRTQRNAPSQTPYANYANVEWDGATAVALGQPGGKPTGRWIYLPEGRYLPNETYRQSIGLYATYGGMRFSLPLPPANAGFQTPGILNNTAAPGDPNMNLHGYSI